MMDRESCRVLMSRNLAMAIYIYMNAVTELVKENFFQVGNWCREQGVNYIGHLIEDDNHHTPQDVPWDIIIVVWPGRIWRGFLMRWGR